MKLGIIGPKAPSDMIAKSLYEIDDKTQMQILQENKSKIVWK